jgi:hypothetical protein
VVGCSNTWVLGDLAFSCILLCRFRSNRMARIFRSVGFLGFLDIFSNQNLRWMACASDDEYENSTVLATFGTA